MVKNTLVVKSNNLIEAKYNLNLNEQKIILYAVSKLDRNIDNFNTLELDVKEFTEAINTSLRRYTEIRQIVRELRKKEIVIKTDTDKKGEKEIITGWLSSIEYKGNGRIELEFSSKLIPYLLQLKERFTRYELKNVLYLDNKYALRIYEFLKQYENIGKRKFSLEQLKEYLMIQNQYDRIYDFERFILKPAKDEINEKTDITIDYEKIKKGRIITEILFTIQPKEQDKIYMEYLKQQYDINDIKKKMGLHEENFNAEQVMNIYEKAVEKAGNQDIDIFEYVRLNYLQIRDKAKNKYAYLLKAVEQDYASAIGQIKFDYYL